MTVLKRGRALNSTRPVVQVDNPLPPGRHRFSLVVIDELGRRSEPDVLVVTVRQPGHGPGRRRT